MGLELNLAGAVALFLGASLVVVISAIALAQAGDVIASRTGLGHLWVGSLLIAGATSLPELVTNVTAVRIDNPGLAAGNILGANMLNVSNLAVIAAVFGGREIFRRLSKGQEYLAIEAFVMTALAATYVFFGPALNWFGVSPPPSPFSSSTSLGPATSTSPARVAAGTPGRRKLRPRPCDGAGRSSSSAHWPLAYPHPPSPSAPTQSPRRQASPPASWVCWPSPS